MQILKKKYFQILCLSSSLVPIIYISACNNEKTVQRVDMRCDSMEFNLGAFVEADHVYGLWYQYLLLCNGTQLSDDNGQTWEDYLGDGSVIMGGYQIPIFFDYQHITSPIILKNQLLYYPNMANTDLNTFDDAVYGDVTFEDGKDPTISNFYFVCLD